jgi:hypothetical protein
VLSIGLGDGKMCAAALAWPEVEELVVVELSGALDEILRRTPQGEAVFGSERLRLIHDDGRRWLLAHPEERFDLVLAWPLHAAHAGSGNLFSLEFFALLRARLAPGGLVYLRSADLYSTARTLALAFPHAVRLRGSRYLAGAAPFAIDPARLGVARADVLAWVEADRETILAATAEAPVNRDLAPNSEFYLTYRYARVLETWGGGEDGGDRYREADRARLERWVAPTPP